MIRKYRAFVSASLAALLLTTTSAAAFDTRATAAFVLDEKTGTVLLAKDADTPLPPASMSKLMTLYIAFEAVRDGRLRLDEELPVSAHANSFGGSTLFLRQGERVSVEDLIRGIIVLSGNDACVVLAEALSPDGTEAGFARMMTQRAQQLGMTNSIFKNSSGWPADGHVMSMRDLTLLAQRLIEDFPDFYPMFAEKEFLFDEAESSNRFNRNPLLALGIGADGLKTGHTQEAGYGLVGSAKQGDRRVIFTITGLDTAQARAQESESIVNWAFRQFAEKTVTRAGAVIAEADVWMGASEKVGLMAKEDVTLLLPNTPGQEVTAEVVYTGPIEAPIAEGRQLAELIISPEGLPEHRIPLFAASAVPASGFVARMMSVSQVLLGRVQAPAEDTM
ncbi:MULTISPECIES: D-alanyl-D-alanine carboxypeptidase family protein [Marivita]|uniref:serine-type D-Ala-D-Ala carboxypeptidase n=1 Tax=Marivita cryptomonadis TaxID=505252 RepID=A0A9Q2S1G5_9RHOB|nr:MULTISPECIES: D-alanyl-D-alanine carboxypeptidase family protein [Marivita]MCR9167995.1 D-alanyl-D-alanine carboxypeptidase [Paracoccaceae bacterium]MBM2321375.1 D-alanyl-D-alanine carboxypeptidase [Marivita cryptomonadis]MBM2330956.1 D-alanyl-D-alanine carboxypeptidase [Marivita cryptomonadis]MBM2340542.1 D-alanyl-D-alanine carboxypeptidase [Marivita cryptomonadis]MBM2345204.1 D-alanyl-D-alanine carboxypeptidase [Marivita cryptomonadis]